MKTLQQQLQSRISLRRNKIRHFEASIEMFKYCGCYNEAKLFRDMVKNLAKEQVLDKKLYAFILEAEYDIKTLDLMLDTMFCSAEIIETPRVNATTITEFPIFFGDADERN
jgi:hypothetical protein